MSILVPHLYLHARFPEDSSDDTFLCVLPVADKYNVNSLKTVCEANLATAISVDNVCQILVLSHLHGCDNLKTKALDFIASHGKSVRTVKPDEILRLGMITYLR